MFYRNKYFQNKILIALAGVVILISSCETDDFYSSIENSNPGNRLIVNNNISELNQRITRFDDYYLEYNNVDSKTKTSGGSENWDDYILVLRAEVAPGNIMGIPCRQLTSE